MSVQHTMVWLYFWDIWLSCVLMWLSMVESIVMLVLDILNHIDFLSMLLFVAY